MVNEGAAILLLGAVPFGWLIVRGLQTGVVRTSYGSPFRRAKAPVAYWSYIGMWACLEAMFVVGAAILQFRGH